MLPHVASEQLPLRIDFVANMALVSLVPDTMGTVLVTPQIGVISVGSITANNFAFKRALPGVGSHVRCQQCGA